MKSLWRWMMMNMTIAIYYELLKELQERKFNPAKYVHRKYICQNKVGIIYSLSVEKRLRALAIPVDNMAKKINFPIWKGIKIDLVVLPEYSKEDQMFIELEQMPGTEGYIFEIVAEDLRRGLEKKPDGKGCSESTYGILKKWKDFFATGKALVLAGSRAQGLYGELLFLKELILVLGTKSVYMWAGESNTHDFYVKRNAIEIKTTSTQAPYFAHINSEYQLDDKDVNGQLYLRMYALRKDNNGGQSLPQIVADIRTLLTEDVPATNSFEDKLQKVGYIDAAEDYYVEGYTIREIYSFKVADDFPRIIRKNTPVGVYDLEYAISIDQCKDFAIEAGKLIEEATR